MHPKMKNAAQDKETVLQWPDNNCLMAKLALCRRFYLHYKCLDFQEIEGAREYMQFFANETVRLETIQRYEE